MNNVNFEGILIKRHHYWRNLLIVLFIAVVIASVWWIQSLEATANPLCAEFSPVEEEITCEEAIDIALEEYPGDVYEIYKSSIRPVENKTMHQKGFWIIGINLKTPIKTSFTETKNIQIAVDIESGKIEKS